MVRPCRFLRALAGAAGSGALCLGLTLAPVSPAVAGASSAVMQAAPDPAPVATLKPRSARTALAAVASPRDTSPLRVTIDGLSPSYLPERGDLVVRGQVTNRTDDTWTTINLYTFLGDDLPAMRSPAALAAAMDEPYDSYVGSRETTAGEPGVIDSLAPGESAPYVVRVPVSAFDVPQGGVYWFGVHAIGQSASSPREDLADGQARADGRARTFLPYVPPRVTTPVHAALVLPLTKSLPYRSDGSIDFAPKWARSLSPDGRLRDLLSFASSSGDIPVTWVVDPALLDGVAQLAAGNPPRSLDPTVPAAGGATTAPADEPSSDPSAPPPPPETATSRAAEAWLSALPSALAGNEVLTVPYGNVDVPAALQHDPTLYQVARAKRSTVLNDLGVEPRAVLTAPGGYLDATSIRSADDDATLLASDRVFARSAPPVADLAGHEVVVASSGATAGSPGPGPSVTAVGLRQRILAEAAVRALRADQESLTVVMPTNWGLDPATEFFSGLNVDWLDLTTVSDLQSTTTATPVTDEELVYPASQRRRQLDPATFAAADDLVKAGDTLQSVLGENFSIAGVVTQQALGAISYEARSDQVAARSSLERSHDWIAERLGKITIAASAGVTLSSESGTFLVTLSNGLDEPVTVSVLAQSDSDLTVRTPDPVLLPPGGRSNVLLEVSTTSNRVHNVTLMVTDTSGSPLGSTDKLPIRSAQVSNVIWLIMGSGVGLLFLAIAIRLVRRVRTARRGGRLEPA